MDLMQIRRQMMGVIAGMANSKKLYVASGTFTPAETIIGITITHNLGKVPKYVTVEIQNEFQPTPWLITAQIIGFGVYINGNPWLRPLNFYYNSTPAYSVASSTWQNGNQCVFRENDMDITNSNNPTAVNQPRYMAGYTYKWTAYAWDD